MENTVLIEFKDKTLEVNLIKFIHNDHSNSITSSGTLKLSIKPEDVISFESNFDKNIDDAIKSNLKTYIHNFEFQANKKCRITVERGYLLERQDMTYTIYLERIHYLFYYTI